jgi:hypothetical protein
VLLDAISYGPIPEDTAFGRTSCGQEATMLLRPTPGAPNAAGGVLFRRGDPNADSRVDIADGVAVLMYLFDGTTVPTCLDAADANDSDTVNIADAIALFGYLFGNAGPLPAPFPGCGRDPTADEISCVSYEPCR